jgi:tetratricopeptide (TPR) repeat protein
MSSRIIECFFVTIVMALWFLCALGAAYASGQRVPIRQTSERQTSGVESASRIGEEAEEELRKGTSLTRGGRFREAIPHLLVARGSASNHYAASFNLSLCYVATNQFTQAVEILSALRNAGHDNADVNNLLAQAYVGNAESEKALAALRRAATLTPTSEKLYLFVADACMGRQQYALGAEVVDLGLRRLPDSAWLHYQRGMFLSLLDQFDLGKDDFELASQLAPDSDVAFVAGAQRGVFEGDIPRTIRVAREGVRRNHNNYLLLALLGEALIRSGIGPGQPEFIEARAALEKSIASRSNYAGSHIALGKLYALENRPGDAITHFEIARELNPANPAVYANLAAAYRRRGDVHQEQLALATLSELNQAQAEKIRSAPGDRKAGYGSRGSDPHP